MSFENFVVLSLATWRLAFMVANENGPGDIFRRLRTWAGARETMNFGWEAETFCGKLLVCFFCLSVWFAVVLYLIYLWLPWLWWFTVLLAISGAASLLHLTAYRNQ